MARFPVDASRAKVIKALETLGFRLMRVHEHITMIRENADGTKTPPDATQSRIYQRIDAKNYLYPGRYPAKRILGSLS